MKLVLIIGGLALAGSVTAWVTAIPDTAFEERAVALGVGPPVAVDTARLAMSAARLRLRDPFRLDRKPADVRYNPWQPVVVAPPPPAPVRPQLSLAGLLGGPPWNALVEGIPGREGGVLLHLGDSVSGVRFVALRGDTVVLVAFDTTWTLTTRRTWR